MTIRVALALCLLGLAASCRASSGISIHAMVLDGKALEISDTRQLTTRADGNVEEAAISPDGKTVAYLADREDARSLCLIKAAGGKATVVMSAAPPANASAEEPSDQSDIWLPKGGLVWSPDGKLLAFRAARFPRPGRAADQPDGGLAVHDYIVVLKSNGAVHATLALEPGSSLEEELFFAPDSGSLATVVNMEVGSAADKAMKPGVLLFELPGGDKRTIYSAEAGYIQLIGWRGAGESLLCSLHRSREHKLIEVPADGGSAQTVKDPVERFEISPSGRYAVVGGRPGVVVEDLESGRTATVATSESASFLAWVPGEQSVMFGLEQPITDDAKQRRRGLQTIWLASLTSAKPSSMCVALDADGSPTCSRDCTRVAYTSAGRLYVAEIAAREPSAYEKLAAGLRLTEEDEKILMMQNGKHIGVAMMMLLSDWNGEYPEEGEGMERLKPYLSALNFLRPGTDREAFRYIHPGVASENDIQNPSETIIGELDPEVYGWRIAIYADGHVKVMPR